MAQIPINLNTTEFKLNDSDFKIGEFTYTPDNIIRDYCGMSSIGNKCMRASQYSSRKVSNQIITSRTQRIFDLGHILEEYIVENLKYIGIEITNQQREIIGFAGHWKGHIDGIACNVPEAPKALHLLEIKTHNNKSFTSLKKDRVQSSKPVHYAQCMRYIRGLKDQGLKIDRGLYVAYNKDTSEYYIERLYYDAGFADDLIRKEQDILLSENLFPRIGNNKSTWYECKWCNHNNVCFGNEPPIINCRSCQHVDLENNGIWRCGLDNKTLSFEDQKVACKMYEVMDMIK